MKPLIEELPIITPKQTLMARSLLGWGINEAASHLGVSKTTLNRYENHHIMIQRSTALLMQRGFEDQGIIFHEGGILLSPELQEEQRNQLLQLYSKHPHSKKAAE